jgi:Mg-chelatase subunit ChlD
VEDFDHFEIDAQVVEKSGAIHGLRLADFVVKDNRSPTTLRYCSQDETSLDIIFAFELSRFMAAQINQIRGAAEIAMSELREGDRVAVISFNKTSRIECRTEATDSADEAAVPAVLRSSAGEGGPAPHSGY